MVSACLLIIYEDNDDVHTDTNLVFEPICRPPDFMFPLPQVHDIVDGVSSRL